MSEFKKFLPMILLAVVFIFGAQFMVSALGSLDAHNNVSEEYRGQYNDTRDISITTISMTKTIPLILGACAFIGLLIYLNKRRK